MRPIPSKLKNQILEDDYYRRCARQDQFCEGRITWEHCFVYAGKQVNEKWAIIPLCWHHHLGKGLDKAVNRAIAIARATAEDLAKYPKKDWNIYV